MAVILIRRGVGGTVEASELNLSSNSVIYVDSSGDVQALSFGVGNALVMMDSGGTTPEFGLLDNDNVDDAAAISYSKLSLGGSIVNADLSSGAFSNITGIGTQTQTLEMNDNLINNLRTLNLTNRIELTLVSGSITPTQSLHTVDTENNDPTDTCTSAGTVQEEIYIFRAAISSRDVTYQDGTLKMNGDFTITHTQDTLVFMGDLEITRSDNTV